MTTDAPAPAPSKRRVFASRLFSTLILWGVIATALQWKSHWMIVLLTGFFGVAGAFEYFRLLRLDNHIRGFNLLGLSICLGYWITTTWWVTSQKSAPPMWLELAALTASVHGSFLLCYRHQLEGIVTLQRIFHNVFGVVYTVIFFGFIVRLMYFKPDGSTMTGLFLVLYLIVVTKFSDMGAYTVGVLFGKHKMIPHISPAKSWEGLVGAFIGSFGAAAITLWLAGPKLAPLNWMHGLLLAPVLCATAVSGDLAESVLKRCVSIKDSGHKLPGIGGILDLTDSLLFTAPVFYFYLEAITA
ncbi:phosphatidate cytidylyltransferase [Brevifollis gellanilyticus]|uniref:Phosphatidate cytidylyltransferase n=1 Tax=Brevifollis gellanilyticus TaxID=748831 RepID=A0A512MG48_9BACT|nr:phosphatidate cytidylyltransferase [Brevifollis gellanilyticus]GEP45723.1 phosphatidate cytidylyltransferase [Brevifollis gellanilyticus]